MLVAIHDWDLPRPRLHHAETIWEVPCLLEKARLPMTYLLGQPEQEQPEPQLQEPEEEQPQPAMMNDVLCLGGVQLFDASVFSR
jgi:hypothetical protein